MKCPEGCTCGKHRRKAEPEVPIPAEPKPEPTEPKLVYHDQSHAYYVDGKRAKGVSTVSKAAGDDYNIRMWNERMIGVGLTVEPEGRNLRENIAAHLDDKQTVNDICEEAKKVAKSHIKADRGTQKHRVLELVLRGKEHLLITDQQRADAEILKRTMDRYKLTPVGDLAEQFVCYTRKELGEITGFEEPGFSLAGRFDAVLDFETASGERKLVDLKGLALDTKIPTPTGWTTMGALGVGDRVFGSDGKTCNVVAKSATKRIGTYVVSFDDGTTVVCDREHIWSTISHQDQHWARKYGIAPQPKPRGIVEIAETVRGFGNQRQHQVLVAGPLVLPEVDLRIDPYLLGTWLGDGNRGRGVITKSEELFDILRADGHRLGAQYVGSNDTTATYGVLGLSHDLEMEELLWNKHIPAQYLRASCGQRLRLLQGLMDTDGTWNIKRRSAVFNSTSKVLAYEFQELALSLGQRAHLAEFTAKGFGKTVTAYAVEFRPVDIVPFRLPQKLAKFQDQTVTTVHAKRRLITAVEPGPDVETQCIAVDSPDNTYLCSEHMIPTHNSGENAVKYPHTTLSQLALYTNAPRISFGEQHGFNKIEVTEWTTMPDDLDHDRAYVLLVENDVKVGTLHELDIQHGWRAAQLVLSINAWRKQFDESRGAVHEVPFNPLTDFMINGVPLSEQIARLQTVNQARIMWKAAKAEALLTDSVREALQAKVDELNGKAVVA